MLYNAFNMSNFQKVADLVEQQGGCMTIKMELLRDIHGVDRLGVHVRKNISQQLESVGLKHYPQELPQYQWDEVRLTKAGSPVDRLIRAVLTPGEANDEVIRKAVGNDAEAVLSRVRELVCD